MPEVIYKVDLPAFTGRNVPIMGNIQIPVPPLPIQREIVRILDNFTELTAELTARKKQYEYYRDTMLSVDTQIPIVKLKDIATEMYRGSGIKRDQVTSEGIPCVRYGEIYTTYNTWFEKCISHTKLEYVSSPKYFEHGDILFAITGESVEDIAKSIAYIGHEKCLAGGDIVVMKHKQNPKYLSYVLSTYNARLQKSKGKIKSKVVVTFRDLEQATIDAIKCFGDDNTKNIVLEKSYQEYMNGFKDIVTGEARRGYVDVVQELKSRFADVDEITTEKEKKEFVKLFGEYLKIENILQNYDEFTNLKELQKIDLADSEALEIFKSTHFVSDEDIKAMQLVDILEERTVQDYRSKYNDIREWIRREREGKEKGNSKIDWDDVVFEVDLLKSQEINLDYILELIYEKNKNTKDKNILIDEIRRIVRASTGNRAKESLIVAFINQTDLDEIQDKASIIDAFFQFAQMEQKREAEELIMEEKLNEEAAKRYILTSLRKEYASENGTDLNEILPKMSPLNPQYHTKKQSVFEKISTFVEKFKGVGGVI